MIRHIERYRDRNSKKRRDESSVRKRKEDDSPSSTISSAMTLISRFRNSKDEDSLSSSYSKNRSSSIESTSSVHQDIAERVIKTTTDDHHNTDRRKSTPYVLDNKGVITASLTIPVQQSNHGLSLNLDEDIPYIEDGNTYVDTGKQQRTIGLVRTPTAPPRRRQRSVSGSDSSIASNVQAIIGSISVIQQGYDSAIGSSATYNSPPHNTTPSSVSSSIADAGIGSPQSWTSSPPTSPDSTHTSVNYIPETVRQQVGSTKPTHLQKTSSKDTPILQKVSFSSTPEVQQLRSKPLEKPSQMQNVQKNLQVAEIQKSPSSPAFSANEPERRQEQKFTPSITSIGNAVLRSKTADFERIAKTESKTKTVTTVTTVDKKKYTKRRYTDSRHQTRHIPDSEALESASNQVKKDDKSVQVQAPIYKRRELISSVPSN